MRITCCHLITLHHITPHHCSYVVIKVDSALCSSRRRTQSLVAVSSPPHILSSSRTHMRCTNVRPTRAQAAQWAALNRLCAVDRISYLQFGSALDDEDESSLSELCAAAASRGTRCFAHHVNPPIAAGLCAQPRFDTIPRSHRLPVTGITCTSSCHRRHTYPRTSMSSVCCSCSTGAAVFYLFMFSFLKHHPP